MASQEEINNQQNLNEATQITLSLEQELLQVLQKRAGIDRTTLDDQQDINDVLQDQVKQLEFQVSSKRLIKSLGNDITRIAEQTYSINKEQLGLTKTDEDLAKKALELDQKVQLIEQQKLKLEKEAKTLSEEDAKLNYDIAASLGEQLRYATQLKQDLANVALSSLKISNNFGVQGFQGLSEISQKIPGLSKFSAPFQEAGEAARGMAANIEEAAMSGGKGLTKEKIKQLGLEKQLGNLSGSAAANQLKAMGPLKKGIMATQAGFKALGPMIKNALGPVALIVEAVKAFMIIDKASGEIAKSMGISAAEGAKLAASSADAAAMSGDLLVSTKDVVAAQMELNQAMGTAVEFSGEFAAEFASIKERTGLSNEAMAMFSQNALVAGTSIKEQLSTVSATVMELNAQSGVMLNAKDIQEGIAKMSKAQLLTAGRNTEELTKQVYQAKLLGVSMQQLESIGDNLLNFESSIASEMEAELLTGKQLNLERARMAALTGDQATLAKEVREQVGTAAEFGEMNKIQQEALAKSFGMQREELAAMLVEQENLEAVKAAGFKSTSEAQEAFNKLIEDGMTAEQAAAEMKRKGLDDTFTAQMKSATAQDKMNAAMEKLTDLFVQIVDPLMPLVDALIGILSPIFAILSPIAKLIGDIVGLVMGVLNPALQLISTYFNGIGDVISGILTLDLSTLMNGFKNLGQLILDVIFFPIDTIMKSLSYIPGIDLPDISTSVGGMIGLAEGGVVTEPTTALIGEGGEPEAVVPLSKAGNFFSDAMGMAGQAFMDYTPLGLAAKGVKNLLGDSEGETETTVVQSPPINLAPLVEQMSQMNSTLQAILAKEGTVTLDGTKVGTALTVANSKLQ